MNIYNARVIAVTDNCNLILDIRLDLGISTNRELPLYGIDIEINEENRTFIINCLARNTIKLNIMNKGKGNFQVVVIKDHINFNNLLVSKGIAKKKSIPQFEETNIGNY